MKVKKIAYALREAKHSLKNIVMFTTLMDTFLIFMICLLVAKLINVPWWTAAIPTAIYAIVHAHANMKEANYRYIEKKFPDLNEQLITVADNWKQNSEIVDALNEETLEKMKIIRTGRFIDFGKMFRQIGIMAVISFLIITTSAFNIQFLDLPETVNKLQEYKPYRNYEIDETLLELQEGENLSDILGEAEILELGKEQIDLELNPIASDAQIGTIQDTTDRSFRSVPPREIKASGAGSFEDQIPREYQKIVKNYFREITQGG